MCNKSELWFNYGSRNVIKFSSTVLSLGWVRTSDRWEVILCARWIYKTQTTRKNVGRGVWQFRRALSRLSPLLFTHSLADIYYYFAGQSRRRDSRVSGLSDAPVWLARSTSRYVRRVKIFLFLSTLSSRQVPFFGSIKFLLRNRQSHNTNFSAGCRSTAVSLEARSMTGWSTSRHCVIVRAMDLAPDAFQSVRSRAGALVIVLPKDINNLSREEEQVIHSQKCFQ